MKNMTITNDFDCKTARHNFLAFCKVIKGDEFQIVAFHELIISALQDLAESKNQNLAISCPPRSGKTTIASLFLAWLIGRDQNACHILSSYGTVITGSIFSRVISILDMDAFSVVFPEYNLGNPNVLPAAIGTSLCGYGVGTTSYESAGLGAFVVDDPVKYIGSLGNNLEEWWEEVASTRLMNNYCRLIIGSRVCDHDLHGIVEKNPEKWRFINIPALCEDPETDVLGRELGESYWPGNPATTPDMLNQQKRAIGDRAFSTIYQGRPLPA